MSVIEPNAILADGPEPLGGRHICAGPNAVEYRAAVADGSEHVWQRSDRVAALKGCGWVRVYAHASVAVEEAARTEEASALTLPDAVRKTPRPGVQTA